MDFIRRRFENAVLHPGGFDGYFNSRRLFGEYSSQVFLEVVKEFKQCFKVYCYLRLIS